MAPKHTELRFPSVVREVVETDDGRGLAPTGRLSDGPTSSNECGSISPESSGSNEDCNTPHEAKSDASVPFPDKSGIGSPLGTGTMAMTFGCYIDDKAMDREQRAFYGTGGAESEDGGNDDKIEGDGAKANLSEENHRSGCGLNSFRAPGRDEKYPSGNDLGRASAVGGAVMEERRSKRSPSHHEAPSPTTRSSRHGHVSAGEGETPPAKAAAKTPKTSPPAEPPPDIVGRASKRASGLVRDECSGFALRDMQLLQERERMLEERVRVLEGKGGAAAAAGPKGLSAFGGALAEQLKKIDLSVDGGTLKVADRSLSENGCAAILNAVKNNDKLTELNLSGCNIYKGDDLAELVRSAPALKRLSLEWNNLGLARTGIAALSSAISAARTLQEVDLRSNRIGPSTAAALAHALRGNNTLTCLDLMWNDIGASGATALLGMLERNHTLTELRLAGNNIPAPLQAQIDSLLERNRAGQLMNHECQTAMATPNQATPALTPALRAASVRSNPIEGSEAQTTPVLNGAIQSEMEKLRQDLGALRTEFKELQQQKAAADSQLETSRAELKEETMHRQHVENETEEIKMELTRLKQEMAGLQEKLHASESDATRRMTMLSTEVMDRKESERVAQEREAEASRESRHLADQLTRLREDSALRIQTTEARSRQESEYNACLVQKLEATIAQRDQKHLNEVEAIRSKLTAEISALQTAKDNLIRELEKQKSMAEIFEQRLANKEQILQQEKEAAEQELKRQIAVLKGDIESLQNQLEEKDMDHSKTKQRLEASVQALENDVKKERAAVTRTELAKAHLEHKVAAMAADMVEQLKETIKAEQERVRLGEEKRQAEEVKHSQCMAALATQHLLDQERINDELLASRKQTEAVNLQVKEMQAEHERRLRDTETQLRAAETAVVEWIQHQFSALQSALNFHNSVPAIDFDIARGTQMIPSSAIVASFRACAEPAIAKPRLQSVATSPSPPPPLRITQSRLPSTHKCLPAPLSVASLVKPVYEEDVGTVDEDLVSSGESSSNYTR